MGAIDENGWSHSTYSISNEDIDTYAKMSGDRNSIHFGPDRIAHGALIFGKVSACVWSRFGHGTMVLAFHGEITRPIKPDESFNVSLSPAQPLEESNRGEHNVEFRLYKWFKGRQKEIMTGVVTIIPKEDQYLKGADRAVA